MNKYLSRRVMLWCHVVFTHIEHIVCMIEMLGMCGIRQPSCLSLVASLMGKCSLVLPWAIVVRYSPVHRSPASPALLLRNTWLAGMWFTSFLCLSLRGNVTLWHPESCLAYYSPVRRSPVSPVLQPGFARCWPTCSMLIHVCLSP